MRRALGICAILAAVAWVYAPSIRGGWLWDDGLEITRNSAVREAGGWWRAWTHPEGMDYFPLKATLQWFEWHLWGDNPAGYRLVNAGLHAVSALLIWRLLGALRIGGAFVGGLVFAVHPLAVESVAWVSEFKNTLSLPLLLLACLAWVEHEDAGGRRAGLRSLGWFVAALACKSSVVMFPCVLLLFAWWKRGRIQRSDLAAAAPFFGAAFAAAVATVWFQSTRAIGVSGPLAPLGERLRQSGWSLLGYLGSSLLPFRLEPVYPPAPASWPGFLPWLAFLGMAAVFWASRRGSGRHALLGAGWFVLNLVPVLGWVPMAYSRVSPRADHFAYISLVAVAGLAAAAFGAAWTRFASRRWAPAALAAALTLGLAAQSRAYARAFFDERSLWTLAISRNPEAWLARSNLGRVYLEEGRPREAASQLREAVRLEPDSAEAHANLGNALGALGEGPEARAEYERAVSLDPALAGARYDLGRLLLQSGDLSGAASQLQAAVMLDPRHARAHDNLGLALARMGRLDEALAQYAIAVSLEPTLKEAYLNWGNTLVRLDRPQEALAKYDQALGLDPSYRAAHNNRGYTLERLGRAAEAEAEFEKAR